MTRISNSDALQMGFTEHLLRYSDRTIQLEHRITLLEARTMEHGKRLRKIETQDKEEASLWSNQIFQIGLGIAMIIGALAVKLITLEQAQSVISYLISGLK